MADSFLDALHDMRAALAPFLQEQRETWEREGPAVMARAERLGITIDSKGGNCPVQAEGSFDQQRFYFRARGDEWSLTVWTGAEDYLATENPHEWGIVRGYGKGFEAGWMPLHEAVGFICDGVEAYRSATQSQQPTPEGREERS